MTDTKIPVRIFTSYELLHQYYGDDSNLLELGLYESEDTLVVGHSPNAYSFNPQYFTGENQYVPNYVPDSPFDPVPPTVPPTEPPVGVADPVITLATHMNSENTNMLWAHITCATEGATTYFTASGWEGEYYNYNEDSQNPELTVDIEGTTYVMIGEPIGTKIVYAYSQLGEATSNTVSMTYIAEPTTSGRYLYIKSAGTEDKNEPGTYFANLPEGLLSDPSPLSGLAGPVTTLYATNIGNEYENNFTISLINTGGYTDANDNWVGVEVKEDYHIDIANEELTITTYITNDERTSTTQVATSTYSLIDYNDYWWSSAGAGTPDYDCGTPVIPIGGNIWLKNDVSTYMTNILGAVSIDDYGFARIKSNTENLTAVIPLVVTDDPNSNYYDEPSKNLMAELQQLCYPNVDKDTKYAEGICSFANYIGLVWTKKKINSNDKPNSIADRLNELEAIGYNINSGQRVKLDTISDDGKIIIPNGSAFKFKTPISFNDENNQLVEDTAIISIATGQEGYQDYIYFHIASQGSLFTHKITHTWTSISDYCTSEGYTGPLTIGRTDFLEFDITGTLLDDIAGCYNITTDDISLGQSYILFNDEVFFCLVKVTDEQSEYYEKSYNLMVGEHAVWFDNNKEILNGGTHNVPYYDGKKYIEIQADAHFAESGE